jgi:hypothetical protein
VALARKSCNSIDTVVPCFHVKLQATQVKPGDWNASAAIIIYLAILAITTVPPTPSSREFLSVESEKRVAH